MNIEESKDRLPHFSDTRGQTIFRYCHQQKTRQNESGEPESYWTCRYALMPGNVSRTDAAARELATTQIRAEAQYQIEGVAGYTQWFQSNVANGLYTPAVGDAMKAYISQVITESNRCEDLIVSAATINDSLEVIPAWPEA